MFSRKNTQMMVQKNRPIKQHFGLRKLSIGVASVLLGLSWAYVGIVNADTTDQNQPVAAVTTEPSASANHIDVSSSTVSASPVASSTPVSSQPESSAEVTPVEVPASSAVNIAGSNQPVTSESQPAAPAQGQPVASPTPAPVQTSPQKEVGTVDTIHTDTILKDKYGIDINHLDAKSVLLLASLFHIFANEANLGCDVNGNIAVGILGGFGTRGDSIHLSKGDIYYIQQLKDALNSGSFRNPEFNHVIFGNDIKVEVIDGKVYVNGQVMNNLKPEEVFKDGNIQYIDFAAVFNRLIKAANFYADQETSSGVVMDFSDMNNQKIDVSNATATDNVIYVNIPGSLLAGSQPIKVYGLSSKDGAPTVVINVLNADGTINIATQVHLYYDDNNSPVNNGESHTVPNRILWNFGNQAEVINITSGRFMGSILAPNATVNAHVNVDGNIIANIVNITGGESHRWDIHPVVPPSFIEIPTPDPDPTPELDSTPDPDPNPIPDPNPETPKDGELTDEDTSKDSQMPVIETT